MLVFFMLSCTELFAADLEDSGLSLGEIKEIADEVETDLITAGSLALETNSANLNLNSLYSSFNPFAPAASIVMRRANNGYIARKANHTTNQKREFIRKFAKTTTGSLRTIQEDTRLSSGKEEMHYSGAVSKITREAVSVLDDTGLSKEDLEEEMTNVAAEILDEAVNKEILAEEVAVEKVVSGLMQGSIDVDLEGVAISSNYNPPTVANTVSMELLNKIKGTTLDPANEADFETVIDIVFDGAAEAMDDSMADAVDVYTEIGIAVYDKTPDDVSNIIITIYDAYDENGMEIPDEIIEMTDPSDVIQELADENVLTEDEKASYDTAIAETNESYEEAKSATPQTPIFKKICDKNSNIDPEGIVDTGACTLTQPSPSPISTIEVIGKHTTDGTDGGTPVSGDGIYVYSDNSCSNLVGSGISNPEGWFAVQVDLSSGALNQVSDLTIRSRNIGGNYSNCSSVFASYTHDDTPPSILTLDSIYPEGPSYKTDPTISIQSDASTSVGIYEDSTCTTSLATGVTDGLGVYTTSLNLAGKLSATTGQAVPIYLYAEDAAGNSTCSALAHTYYLYQLYTARYTVSQTESLNSVTNPATAEHLKYTLVNQTGFSLNGTDEIQVPQTGDILLMVNLPVVNTTGQRSATRLYAEVIDGTDTVSYRSEFSQSSYVRGLDGHFESSTTLNTLLPNVAAGDFVRIKVEQAGPAGSEQSFDGSAPTTVYLEYLDEVRPYYAAEITGPVDGSDIANFDYMPISSEFTIAEKVKSTSAASLGFAVNSSRAIVLPEASSYLVTLNVPFTTSTAMQRCAPQINLLLEGNLVGIARQAYIRGNHSPYHRYSSNHWIGIIESANANEELVFEISSDGNAGDCNDPGELLFNTLNNAGQSADVKGLIYVEKIDTSYGFAQLSSAGVTNGTESVYWNQDRASNYYVNYEAFVNNDSIKFSLNTSTEEITIAETGNYIGGFTAPFKTVSQRGNVKVEALLDGAVVGTTQSAYVRNASSHVYSSTAMSFPFDATASDALRLRSSAGANGPTDFNSLQVEGSAKLFIWKRD
jgi:hypothetical protein